MGWKRLRSTFLVSLAIWLIGGASVQIAMHRGGGNIYTLLNLHTVFVTGFGSLTVVLGAILLGRWIWLKRSHLPSDPKRQPFARDPITMRGEKDKNSESNEVQKSNAADRWSALVRYDEEICAAAEKLRPFGDSWVDKLGQAYVALNEDRKYLPNILSRLIEEANQEKAQRWADRFRRTYDNEVCTEKSLDIIREAELQGYTLTVEENRTIVVTKNTQISYLRSNGDIQRFGKMSLVKKSN